QRVNTNQTQRTQQAQFTQLVEAQSTLIAEQTVLASTATMSNLVNSVTMTAGAQYSDSNIATQNANVALQAQLQNTAVALQSTG
ncbi:MAG TPA: hypothetical protein PLZ51_28465, partial [Aggregatilineales bacterium]|nr:hypothetical protein [Aggregatilineales bacterium]